MHTFTKALVAATLGLACISTTGAVADNAEMLAWPGCSFSLGAGSSQSRSALIYSSPLVVADIIDDESDGGTSLSPANPVTVVCAIKLNNKDALSGPAVLTRYSSPGIGASVLPPTSAEIPMSPTDQAFICSGFWFKAPDGTWIHSWDDFDDNLENGVTCAPESSLGSF